MLVKHSTFEGDITAVVTPMNGYRNLDSDIFGRLLGWVVREGMGAVVVNGITGESATLDDKEKMAVARHVIRQVDGRTPVIVSMGSNCMEHAVELSRKAQGLGADALLQVMPYYSKASQDRLMCYSTQVADHVSIPTPLYNVSSRTRMTTQSETCKILPEHPNIRGTKEASDGLSPIAKTVALCGGGFDVYSSNDSQTVPITPLGGRGVVSTLADIMPREIRQVCRLYLDGDVKENRRTQLKPLEIMEALFQDVNPMPVKAAPCMMRARGDDPHLSLTPMKSEQGERLAEVMRRQEINLRKELCNQTNLP